MNNKLKILITMGVALGGIRAARANPLAVSEARMELARLTAARSEAKNTLDKDKLAYSKLNQATSKQTKVLKVLIAADQATVIAERASQSSVSNGRGINGYLSESLAPGAAARLISSPEVEKPRYLEESPSYLQGS